MTGKQQNPDADSLPSFGEILINPDAGEKSESEEQPSPPPSEQESKPGKAPAQRKKSTQSKKRAKRPLLFRSPVLLLLLPVLLFLSYLSAARYLLPYYIRNPLAEQYSRQLNRPVAVTKVHFAPFTWKLRLAGIYIGPEFGRQNEKEPALCHIAVLDTGLRPQGLLNGNIVLENVRIQGMHAELLRRADGSFTDLGRAGAENREAGMLGQALLPDRLRIDGLSLTDSMLLIRDAADGHEYHLDQISFSLPSAATRQDEEAATLHAVVNGNPVQIQGQRQTGPDGSSRTRLLLRLDDLDPQQILSWLPGLSSHALRIRAERTKALLELILPDNPRDKDGPILSGTVSLTGLNLRAITHDNWTERAGKVQCSAAEAELLLRANLFRKQYRVENLTLSSPLFIIPPSTEKKQQARPPLSHWPGQVFNLASLPVDLMIKQLNINNGTVQRGGKKQGELWEDLQLTLTDYRNQSPPPAEKNQTGEAQATALSFSARQGETRVRFQGSTAPDLSLNGKITLDNLDSSLLLPYLSAEKALQLSGGKAHLLMRTDPEQKKYTVADWIVEQAQLVVNNLSEKGKSGRLPFLIRIGELLDPTALPFDLTIRHLTVNKGKIQRKKELPWENVQLELKEYRNRNRSKTAAQTAALSFSARQGETRVQFQGSTAPDLSLNGKITLDNLDSSLLQPYLGAEKALRLSGGTINLTGVLHKTEAGGNERATVIERAAVQIPDIRLKQGTKAEDKVLLSAGKAEVQGCTINLTAPSLACADLLLQQAGFSSDAPGFFLFPEKAKNALNLSVNNIKIIDSKALLPLNSKKNSLTVPLSELNLELKNLHRVASKQDKDNLQLEAVLGAKGKLRADGVFRRGKGSIQLTAEKIDLSLLNSGFKELFQKDLAPALQQGSLSFQGRLQLPKFHFQGAIQVDDLLAANKQGAALTWKSGQGKQVSVKLNPFFLYAEEVILEEPDLKLPSAERNVPVILSSLLRKKEKKALLPPFSVQQCRIQGGSMLGAGDRPGFSKVDGHFAHLTAGTAASFTFSGKINDREFSAQGQLEQKGAKLDSFEAAKPPEPPAPAKAEKTSEKILTPTPKKHAESRKKTDSFKAAQSSEPPAQTEKVSSETEKITERKSSAQVQEQPKQEQADLDKSAATESPFEDTAEQLAEQLKLAMKGKGEIRWIPAVAEKDQSRVHFNDFRPEPGSEYALLLALLIDSTGEFSLPLSLPATASSAEISKTALKKLHHLHLRAIVSPQAFLEKELPDLTLPRRVDFIVGDSLPDFMTELENIVPLLQRRPYIDVHVRGCYDDTADREYLLSRLQEEEDYRIDLENSRRNEEMGRLLAEEELRQVELINTDMPIGEDRLPMIKAREDLQALPYQPAELPDEILPELARQRAGVVHEFLVDTLKLPPERISLTKPSPGGPKVDIQLVPNWR